MSNNQMTTKADRIEENNKQRTVRAITAIANRDDDVIEELVAEELIHHSLGMASTREGRDAWWGRLGEMLDAFPDLDIEIEDMAAEGNRVFCRVIMSGTMKQSFDGVAPSGRRAETAGFHVLRFEDGRIVEWWRLTNLMGWAQQLDVLPFGPRALLRIIGRQLRWKLGGGRKS